MKKKGYDYNFDYSEELFIYSCIGRKNSKYRNYSEWLDYVTKKYDIKEYWGTNGINFLHYLIKLRNSVGVLKATCSNSLFTYFTSLTSLLIISFQQKKYLEDILHSNLIGLYTDNQELKEYFTDMLFENHDISFNNFKIFIFYNGMFLLFLYSNS